MEEAKLCNNVCQIKVPKGLQELMSDISREVLRAQPKNVYSFIANYLHALLEVRDNIYIADEVCNDIVESSYQPEAIEEFRNSLIKEDSVENKEIMEIFSQSSTDDNVSSTSLAGSYVTLPRHTPYSAHQDTLSSISEGTDDWASEETLAHRTKVMKDIRFQTDVIEYFTHERCSTTDTESSF